MEKKFTRAMVCKEFKSKCRECPLHCTNNFKSLPCSVLTDDDIQFIMKDYPYTDVKVRMIFNDIETRLTAVEKKVEKKDEPKFTMFPVVAKKLYDELESKHESDCRLISEYDLEIKRLKEEISTLNKQIDSFGLTCRLYEKETKDLKSDVERWVQRYERIRDMDKKRLFDFKNTENERDYYKRLYSFKCDDYDALLEKQLKIEKEVAFYRNSYHECCSEKNDHIEKEHDLKEEVIKLTEQKDSYKNLFHSLNHKHQKVVGEMKHWKERAIEAEKKLKETEEKLKHAEEVGDHYKLLYDTTCDNYDKLEENYNKLLKDYKLLSESNNNHATDNIELEGELEAKTNRIAALEDKLRNQRTNLASLQEKYEDALKMNKAREDVYYSNIKLKKTIESKDREIGLLRAELDKYKTNDECDDSWID